MRKRLVVIGILDRDFGRTKSPRLMFRRLTDDVKPWASRKRNHAAMLSCTA